MGLIQSYRDERARQIFIDRRSPKGFPAPVDVTRRKLVHLDAATRLSDLRAPPGNHLEALKGDLEGYHAIRVNKQWRIVFRWTDAGPAEVQITDN